MLWLMHIAMMCCKTIVMTVLKAVCLNMLDSSNPRISSCNVTKRIEAEMAIPLAPASSVLVMPFSCVQISECSQQTFLYSCLYLLCINMHTYPTGTGKKCDGSVAPDNTCTRYLNLSTIIATGMQQQACWVLENAENTNKQQTQLPVPCCLKVTP